ncbi:MAG: PEP-CTERM sorting domain-containing protein [Phycisphaerales bacterium]
MVRSLKSRLDRHFVACSAAAAAATVAVVPQQSAEAAIVYSGVVNINIPSTTAGVYVNFVTGLNSSVPASVPGWDVNPWSTTALNYFNPGAPAGGVYVQGGGTGTNTANLVPGTLISAASVYGAGTAASTGLLPHVFNSSNNIVGFRFQNEANGNATHYGWMRISLSATFGAQPRAIVEYAYENVAGAGINAGDVPTPGSLALLALGAVGLAGRRRR